MMRGALLVVIIMGLARAALAQNIDMSTVPDRDSVQLTIYNAEDLTLVRETRRITLRRGSNQLQFSWANTLVDPTSVTLTFGSARTGVDVIDTRLPFDRPEALYWTVQSEFDGEAIASISYFTSGISWSCDYVGIVEAARPGAAEQSMAFDGFVRTRACAWWSEASISWRRSPTWRAADCCRCRRARLRREDRRPHRESASRARRRPSR